MSTLERRHQLRLLQRLLDEPDLPARVRSLAPSALAKVVAEVGLEDAGEIVALATTDQLLGVFDVDLWRSEGPGVDEELDAQRFATWLEVMLEAGPGVAAQRIAELPDELVTATFMALILVLDVDALGPRLRGAEGELVERVLEATQYIEVDRYLVIWCGGDGWEAFVAMLMELTPDLRDLLLESCADATMERSERDGLHRVLSRVESAAEDAAAERAERRAGAGHVAPSDATSFLRLAETTPLRKILKGGRDPIVRAYFRELREPGLRAEEAASQAEPLAALPASESTPETESLLRDALLSLREVDPAAYADRLEELAFLLNTVIAGCGIDDRRLRPGEATLVVLAVAEIGLAHLGDPNAIGDHGVDKLFRIGWHLLGHGLRADAWSRIPPATCELLRNLQVA